MRVLQTSDDSPAITVSEVCFTIIVIFIVFLNCFFVFRKKEDDGSTKFDVSINGTTDTTNPISSLFLLTFENIKSFFNLKTNEKKQSFCKKIVCIVGFC